MSPLHRHPGRRARTTGSRWRSCLIAPPAMAAGAALEFFLDPRNGRKRRRESRDRASATVRRRARRLRRYVRYHEGKLVGLVHATVPGRQSGELDDVTLVRKVETELFRNSAVPKGQISINAEHGIVVLRGQIDDAWQIPPIEHAVRKIGGVHDVDNLLHPPALRSPASRPRRSRSPGPR